MSNSQVTSPETRSPPSRRPRTNRTTRPTTPRCVGPLTFRCDGAEEERPVCSVAPRRSHGSGPGSAAPAMAGPITGHDATSTGSISKILRAGDIVTGVGRRTETSS